MITQTNLIMGMPITIKAPRARGMKAVFDFFRYVDATYSPFITTSDVSRINRGELREADYSDELREIIALAETTTHETHGYFNPWHNDVFDPSGIVKSWAIARAGAMMTQVTDDWYVEAGGDIQVHGNNEAGGAWRIGVRNPFQRDENIAVVALPGYAIATSGTAIRGQHIYDPVGGKALEQIVSLSVIAPSIVDADRMATAAFAMGRIGIQFIESLAGYEGYAVDADGMATQTSGWKEYVLA